MSELVFDLTDPEDEDWLRVSEAGLEDLAISLPPGTDLMAYFREHPETPMAKAVLSGRLRIPEHLPQSQIGQSERQLDALRQQFGLPPRH